MNLNKLFLHWIAVFGMVMMFSVPNALADETQSDNFTSSLEGWTGNISRVDFSSSQRMRISQDGTATKTFTFTTPDYANANVTISFNLRLDDDWENDDDVYVYANGTQIAHYNHTDGSYDKTLSTTTNASGQVVLSISTDTSSSSEYAYIDNISVTAIGPVVQSPPVMGNVPNQTFTVGTAYSLNISSYVTLTNADAITSYTLTGTLPIGLNFNTTTGVISGTPTSVTASRSFSVTATDNDGASNADTFSITVIAAPVATEGYRDFTLRKQLYAKGNIKTIGNTILVNPTDSKNNNYCSTYTNGTFEDGDGSTSNAGYYLCGYSVDGSQTNATTSELDLPLGAKVIWAGLYWQSIVANGDWNSNMTIRFRKDGNAYENITPDKLDYQEDSGHDGYTSYSAFKDVSSYFGENKWNEGNYTVSNIPVYEGYIPSLGTYGAWSLVAIYEVNGEKFRSFSVFDGWRVIQTASAGTEYSYTIPVSGFYTPNRVLDSTAAKVSIFAAEGDAYFGASNDRRDVLSTINYNNGQVVNLGTQYNTFNSSISGGGYRRPNLTNNFGIDIQSFDIGTYLQPKQTDMNFKFTTFQDTFWPSMIAFATELVAPQLCYDYSFKQDGHYLKADNNGSQLPLLTGYISEEPIETAIYLRNNEADIKAEGISFYTDVNATVFDYLNGTVATSNINGSVFIPRAETNGGCGYDDAATTPIGCNSGANIRIGIGGDATGYSQAGGGNLGDREFVYAKFSMDPIGVNGIVEVNQSLGLKLNYYIIPKTGATPIPYDYEFGTDIVMCPPSSGYSPAWGTFNVIDRNAGSYSSNGQTLPTNNLRTQISRKQFAVDVAAYGKHTDNTYTIRPTADINTTVLVEMIDNDAFHDANASCANPDSNVSQAIYVPLTIRSGASGDMTDPVPTQLIPYYNFAVKNASFRIWYFNDKDDLLIQNWTANVSDPDYKLNLQSISNLYKSDTHTLCASGQPTPNCSTPTSTNCFECIRRNYAKPLCSRDNFAVRPESYDLRIYDVNQSLEQNSTLKNLTKIDLSNQFQYAPMYGFATDRMNLAAGYNYRYDMNATGNDINLAKVPGYTRYFNGANSDYNATMIWEPSVGQITTGCNDTSGKSMTFYIANGQMSNSEQNQTQVGEYRLNIIDPAWTAVDWQSSLTTHHTSGFLSGLDCVDASTSTTTDSDGKVGCITSSEHTGGGYNYKDHFLKLKPSKFDLNSILYGFGKTPFVIGAGGNGYVYNSDLGVNNDMAMSVRAYGPIKAVGYGGETLSNFVKDCYAVDLNLSIGHDANVSLDFIGRMIVAETNGTQIHDSLKFAVDGDLVRTIEDTYFGKTSNGQTVPTIRLNFDRNVTMPVVPQYVQYFDLDVSCLSQSDCNLSAMSNHTPNTAAGTDQLDFNITHVYGRVIARNTRVNINTDFEVKALYEVYQSPHLVGSALSADQFDSDWYVNEVHDDINFGDAIVTVIDPVSGSNLPVHSSSINGIETFDFDAFTDRQGYKAHIDTEGWLWYGGINAFPYADPNGPLHAGADNLNCLTHPCFNITLGRIIGNTGSAKTESEDHKANKSTTSTGWSTTSEYAPAAQ